MVVSTSETQDKLQLATKATEEALGVAIGASTIRRWHEDGVAGVKLNAKRIGARLHCTHSDVVRFQAAVDAAKSRG